MTATLAADRLARLSSQIDSLVAQVEGARRSSLLKDPVNDAWSANRVLAHIAEFLPYWAAEAEDVASRDEVGGLFGRTHDDPVRIAFVEDHAYDATSDLLRRVHAGLAAATATLQRIPERGWRRSGRHSRRGEMSVEEIVDAFLVDHLLEHVRQAENALAERRLQ